MNDPYAVLGIQRNATDEEVKSAYRELARKYHPDRYADNPLSDLAAEKMKEINEAYDAIMNERRSKSGTYTTDSSDQSGTSSFPEVRSLINKGALEQAQELLDGVQPHMRNAEWYFLNGTVLYRRGWFDQAYTSFSTACRMDPMNKEYQTALNKSKNQTQNPYNPYRSYGGGGSCDGCDICQGLICADCCCECMGGNLIPCLGCR